MSVWICAHGTGLPEAGVPGAVSLSVGILETELGSSGIEASTLNC